MSEKKYLVAEEEEFSYQRDEKGFIYIYIYIYIYYMYIYIYIYINIIYI